MLGKASITVFKDLRTISTCQNLCYPRKKAVLDSQGLLRWTNYVETLKKGEEVIASTNFGTVCLYSMNEYTTKPNQDICQFCYIQKSIRIPDIESNDVMLSLIHI